VATAFALLGLGLEIGDPLVKLCLNFRFGCDPVQLTAAPGHCAESVRVHVSSAFLPLWIENMLRTTGFQINQID
jgi:hypothetical protein